MQNLKVGQPVHVGWNAAKWCDERGSFTGRVEAVGYDWVVFRDNYGKAYSAVVPLTCQAEFLKEVTEPTDDED